MGNSWTAKSVGPLVGERPVLIVLGGFGGAGKTTLARRMSAELGIPRLGSDDLIRIVGQSQPLADRGADVGWIAYDVLFGLTEDFLRSGLSVILDSNMGEEWRWQRVDAIRDRHPGILLVSIILRLPLEVCVERMRRRHTVDPEHEVPAEAIMAEPRHVRKWHFVESLDRPEVHFVDADRPRDAVYEEVRRYLLTRTSDRQTDETPLGGRT